MVTSSLSYFTVGTSKRCWSVFGISQCSSTVFPCACMPILVMIAMQQIINFFFILLFFRFRLISDFDAKV